MPAQTELLQIVPGFIVGLLIGFTGVGGGALMTPYLILGLGLPPRIAVATDLLFGCLTKIAGSAMHGRLRGVDTLVLSRLALGSIPAAIITGWLIHTDIIGLQLRNDRLILGILGVMLLLTAVGLLLGGYWHRRGRSLRLAHAEKFKRVQRPLTIMLGLVLGVVVTLTSVGAGALGAAIMATLYPLRLTGARLVGTDIVHAMLLGLVASTGYVLGGDIDYALLLKLLAGSVPGILIGSALSHRLPDAWLKILISLLLGVSGIKLLA